MCSRVTWTLEFWGTLAEFSFGGAEIFLVFFFQVDDVIIWFCFPLKLMLSGLCWDLSVIFYYLKFFFRCYFLIYWFCFSSPAPFQSGWKPGLVCARQAPYLSPAPPSGLQAHVTHTFTVSLSSPILLRSLWFLCVPRFAGLSSCSFTCLPLCLICSRTNLLILQCRNRIFLTFKLIYLKNMI